MESALSHLPCEVVGQEPYWLINKHSWALRRDTSSLLATVHMALSDMKDFLNKCLEDAGLVGETKLISKALLDQFSNHFEWIQKVVLHPAMCNSQVSNIIGASMATLQPLTAFSFTSVVDQVIDRIGLTVPTKPNKDGDPGIPACDGAGSHQIATQCLNAQFKALLHELCEGTKDTRPHWYIPEALHLEYWKDFESRHPRYVAPTLPVSILDQAKEEMRQLRELMPHAPTAGLVVMGANELWQELCNTSPSQWQKKFESILEAQRHHQSRPQPNPPAPSAPTVAPKDPKPIEPKGDGDQGDPEVKKEDKPQEPPSKPPGLPLEWPVIWIQPQAKDEPETKEEPKAKEEPETKDKPVAPSNSAGKNKRFRSSKVDPEEPPAKWPTQPQVVGKVTLEGEAVSKDKASEFKCNISLKRIQASDGFYIFKSDGDKGGEGEFDDEEEEEEDDCKVEIPDLNWDGDEGDAPNDCQTSKSDSKTEPDDEEDIGEEEHPKKKSHKDKKKKRSSHNKKSKVEEEEEDLDEPEVPFIQRLWKVCYKKFCENTDEANYIKGILLGLGSGVIPTQTQIDQSKLFHEWPSDKTAPVADVSDSWMPILEERLWLATEAPDRMKHKDGTAPLYKFKDLIKLVPSAAGAWTAKSAKPALVAVIPPTTTTPLETAIGVEGLHNVAALRKVTIPKLSGDPEKKAKQFSFCGYCGVQIENFEMDVNHIWHHLCLELLCAGCYGKAFITNVQMSSHFKKCEAILNILRQLGDSKQGGSQSRKR